MENKSIKKEVILNLIQDLQRLLLPFINGVRGRFRIKYGMTQLYNLGFTLIELLVVVLIIGILAAVAVPQYQKAVAKTRLMSIVPVFKHLKEGRKLYLASGGSTTCMDLSAYLDAIGVEYYRFRCTGASADGPCVDSYWCDGALWLTSQEGILQSTGHAYYTYEKNGYKVRLTLVTYTQGFTSDEHTGDFFCALDEENEKNRSLCKSISSSQESVKCTSKKRECYRVNL